MADQSGSEETVSSSDSMGGGIGSILYAGFFLAIGFIILFDTSTHLTTLYGGSVHAPIEIWVRVLITSIVGSTAVLSSLSVVIQISQK